MNLWVIRVVEDWGLIATLPAKPWSIVLTGAYIGDAALRKLNQEKEAKKENS